MSRGEVRALAVEGVGTAVLCAAAVGAGLLAERIPGQIPLSADRLVALTAGGVLAALMLGAAGARFNPALTLAEIIQGREALEPGARRVAAQLAGAILGAMAANAAFDMGAVQHAGRALTGPGVWAGEAAATSVFVLAVGLAMPLGRLALALVSGVALAVVYLLTPAMSLANPALLIARTLSDSHLGVRAGDAPLLLACQIGAAVLAGLACTWLARTRRVRDQTARL